MKTISFLPSVTALLNYWLCLREETIFVIKKFKLNVKPSTFLKSFLEKQQFPGQIASLSVIRGVFDVCGKSIYNFIEDAPFMVWNYKVN